MSDEYQHPEGTSGHRRANKIQAVSKDQILALYQAELVTASTEATPELVKLHAWRGTRTRVHAALQELGAPPGKVAGLRDPKGDIHHEIQKLHFMDLWVETDELALAAGVTAEGLVS